MIQADSAVVGSKLDDTLVDQAVEHRQQTLLTNGIL